MTLVVSLWICSILRSKPFMTASTMGVCKVARSAANSRSRARPSLSSPILPCDQSHIVECDPFANCIERVALDQDVLDQGEQCIGVAGVLQCQRQLFLEPHALDEAVQNRECAHAHSA